MARSSSRTRMLRGEETGIIFSRFAEPLIPVRITAGSFPDHLRDDENHYRTDKAAAENEIKQRIAGGGEGHDQCGKIIHGLWG
jgi:hypothetical protein